MTYKLDKVTGRPTENDEIKVRLNCNGVLTLYTDRDGLHIELDKNTTDLDFGRLAVTSSPYNHGMMIFVRGTEKEE